MPCYQVRTVSMNVGRLDARILGKALEKVGLKAVTVDVKHNTVAAMTSTYGAVRYENGQLNVPQNWTGAKQVSEQYSLATVEDKAQQMGWDITSQQLDADGNIVLEIER